jgi:hypothetical protein
MFKLPKMMPLSYYDALQPYQLAVHILQDSYHQRRNGSIVNSDGNQTYYHSYAVILWCSPQTWERIGCNADAYEVIRQSRVKPILVRGFLGVLTACIVDGKYDAEPIGFPSEKTRAYPALCRYYLPEEFKAAEDQLRNTNLDTIPVPYHSAETADQSHVAAMAMSLDHILRRNAIMDPVVLREQWAANHDDRFQDYICEYAEPTVQEQLDSFTKSARSLARRIERLAEAWGGES